MSPQLTSHSGLGNHLFSSAPAFTVLTAVCASPSVCNAVYVPVSMCPSGEAQNSNQSPCGGALEVAQFSSPWSCMPATSPGGVLPLAQASPFKKGHFSLI